MAAALFEWSIPAWVLLLVFVGVFELVRSRRRRRTNTAVSGAVVDELTAFYYGTKRLELDHRNATSVLREDQARGAPPRRVDLDRGVVVLGPNRPAADDRPAGR